MRNHSISSWLCSCVLSEGLSEVRKISFVGDLQSLFQKHWNLNFQERKYTFISMYLKQVMSGITISCFKTIQFFLPGNRPSKLLMIMSTTKVSGTLHSLTRKKPSHPYRKKKWFASLQKEAYMFLCMCQVFKMYSLCVLCFFCPHLILMKI